MAKKPVVFRSISQQNTAAHMIPFHKKDKRIIFLKSEIDKWLISEQNKSIREIRSEAKAF